MIVLSLSMTIIMSATDKIVPVLSDWKIAKNVKLCSNTPQAAYVKMVAKYCNNEYTKCLLSKWINIDYSGGYMKLEVKNV